MQPIPAIWRIDVEPDGFPADAPKQWHGFPAMAALVRELRPRLADRAGAAVHPTWFLQLDPGIERVYGRADFAVRTHRALVDEISAVGDPFGIHVHYHRWDEQRRVVYSEHADRAWSAHCIDVAARAFEQCLGERPRRSSQGGYFFDEHVAARIAAAGIAVDVTPEPGLLAKDADASFGAYVTAPSSDFRAFPRRPYYPSPDSLSTPATSAAGARPLLIVPLTAYDYDGAMAAWPRRFARRLLQRPHLHLPLNPWKAWPQPDVYWDLVARAVDEGPARYVAFAVRTDGPDSASHRRVRSILEYLPRHPIARQLQFVDPLSPAIAALARAGLDGA